MSRTQIVTDRFDSKYAVQPEEDIDLSSLRNKTVVITGGGSGIGEASLRAFVKAGAFVVFDDILEERGNNLVKEFGDRVHFVQGDVTIWADQAKLFKTAFELSPTKSVDVVFANAGIVRPDGIMDNSVDENGEPKEPNTAIIGANLIGVIYTVKLARHYFGLKAIGENMGSSLIITASLAGYLDHPSSVEYAASKWGVRGLMRALRSPFEELQMRVNVIAPWYIRTRLAEGRLWDALERDHGVELAEVDDAASAVLQLAADKSINGRTLAIVPRCATKLGYIDMDRDSLDFEHMCVTWYGLSKPGETGKATE